jgi:transglutaminase-like putative cysteine protease
MIYQISHTTRYRYQNPVSLCHNTACLAPRNTEYQQRVSGAIDVDPAPAILHRYVDYFGNTAHYFSLQHPHTELTVTSLSLIDIDHSGFLPLPTTSPPWEHVREAIRTYANDSLQTQEYSLSSPYVPFLPELYDYAQISFLPQRPIVDATLDLMRRIFSEFQYDPEFTSLVTPLTTVFKHKRGVCQDFAHLMLSCLRSLGLAARYVSGYLETLPPPGKVKLQGSDASHAWISVFVPESGWVDFDPTNNQIPTTQHLVTAWGRDYSDVAPLKGVIFGGGAHTIEVAVDVEPQPE